MLKRTANQKELLKAVHQTDQATGQALVIEPIPVDSLGVHVSPIQRGLQYE